MQGYARWRGRQWKDTELCEAATEEEAIGAGRVDGLRGVEADGEGANDACDAVHLWKVMEGRGRQWQVGGMQWQAGERSAEGRWKAMEGSSSVVPGTEETSRASSTRSRSLRKKTP